MHKKTGIKMRVARHIGNGGIVRATKVKHQTGTHTLTAGPYRTSVLSINRFAVISTGKHPDAKWAHPRVNAWAAASEIVDFVGPDGDYAYN
jgi:hypothetical protein